MARPASSSSAVDGACGRAKEPYRIRYPTSVADLGEIIRRERRKAGVSQRSLARRAGTSQAAISRIEAGLEEPGFDRFKAIMQSLGLEPVVTVAPVGSHRYERRQLAWEVARDPATRVREGFNGADLIRELGAQPGA